MALKIKLNIKIKYTSIFPLTSGFNWKKSFP